MHLSAIGRYDPHVDLLVEHSLLSNLREVLLERLQCEVGLALVDAPEALAHKLLLEGGLVGPHLHLRGVDPVDGIVEVEYAAMANLRCRFHLAAIKPVGAEAHDVVVHAILHL